MGGDCLNKIPELAKGTVIPHGISELQLKEAKEKQLLKQQHRHDLFIATYGIIGGILGGVISSLLVIWLTGNM